MNSSNFGSNGKREKAKFFSKACTPERKNSENKIITLKYPNELQNDNSIFKQQENENNEILTQIKELFKNIHMEPNYKAKQNIIKLEKVDEELKQSFNDQYLANNYLYDKAISICKSPLTPDLTEEYIDSDSNKVNIHILQQRKLDEQARLKNIK